MNFLGSSFLMVVSEEGFIFRAHLRSMVYLGDDQELARVEVQSVKEKERAGRLCRDPVTIASVPP